MDAHLELIRRTASAQPGLAVTIDQWPKPVRLASDDRDHHHSFRLWRSASCSFRESIGTQYAGVPLWKRLPSASGPASTTSNPNWLTRSATTFFAAASSPAIGSALPSGQPAGRPSLSIYDAWIALKTLTTFDLGRWRARSSLVVISSRSSSPIWPSRSG